MSAATPKGQVGVIGLGIMGGAIAKNLAAAGWQVIGFDIDERALRGGEGRGRRDREDAAAVAAKATNILVSLPKPEALTATVDALVACEAAAPRDRRAFDLLDRRQDAGRGGAARGGSRDARLPALRHRRAGANRRPRRLCERRRAGDPGA